MNERFVVEVPLDVDYLTEDGLYMAGYLWGKHVRNPNTLGDVPETFLLGARDGYGETWAGEVGNETLAKNKAARDKNREELIRARQAMKSMIKYMDDKYDP